MFGFSSAMIPSIIFSKLIIKHVLNVNHLTRNVKPSLDIKTLGSDKIRLDISYESSARQAVNMKCQALYYMKQKA